MMTSLCSLGRNIFGWPLFGIFVLFFTRCQSPQEQDSLGASGYQLQPVPFNEVSLTDHFWKPRLATQAQTLVPFALDKTRPAVENLEKAAKFLKGDTTDLPFPHRFVSSDLYKVMEGAALLLTENPDPALESRMDSIINIIGEAQQDDGYLYVAHITGVSRNHDHWGGGGMGDKPYSFVLHSHELYNMGHMYEAAVAYYRATGKDQWLKIAEKNAQHINRVFFEGDPNYNGGKPVNQAPGHEEIELALVKLYRVTENPLYLQMAKKFLDIRGVTFQPDGEGVMAESYAQQQEPVSEQKEAIGHAVRATYLYSGMADVGALTGSKEYDDALDHIWHNIIDSKMHITGGLGAVHGIEGFGPEYVLPNKEAYNETCAAVGNVLFNYRMFLLHQDARYMDVAEVSLFNNSLAGVNLEGNKFFYVNPLESDGRFPFNHGKPGRSPWFNTACCPSNIARLIPQVAGFMYAYTPDQLYVPFFASNHATIPLADGQVEVEQTSDYPFDEYVRLKINPAKKQSFALKLRVPSWAREQFVPGQLYAYTSKSAQAWSVKVNGELVKAPLDKGFVVVDRQWKPGDQVELYLPMPVRFNTARPEVMADRQRIAISRGPLVYCAEEPDNAGVVQRFFLDSLPASKDIQTQKITDGQLSGIAKIQLPAKSKTPEGIRSENLSLIPYYAWNNRGDASMIVWLPTQSDMVLFEEGNALKGGKFQRVKASSTSERGDLGALQVSQQPKSSDDRTIPAWASEPQEENSWVEIGLDNHKPIQSINIYWAEMDGWIKRPKQWSVEYLENGVWKPFKVYVTDSYATQANQYNMIHPGEPLQCEGIRINMQSEKGTAVGILDIDIAFENTSGV